MDARDLEIERINSWRTIQSCMLRLQWLAAATRFELAMRRHDRALKYAYKYGYNPGQPRDEIGRWTDTGGGQNGIRLAGEIPTGDPPEIPKEKPSTSRERTGIAKTVARLLGPAATVAEIAKFGAWLTTYAPSIQSYSDPARSLEELQQSVSMPAAGYDNHHIVEHSQAAADGFTREVIDDPDNLVRIPRMKHWEINKWYQTENPDYGRQRPREYLSGRSWEVRRSVGLDALIEAGVLKP